MILQGFFDNFFKEGRKISSNDELSMRFQVKRVLFRNEEDFFTIASVDILEIDNNKYLLDQVVILGKFFSLKKEDVFQAAGLWTLRKKDNSPQIEILLAKLEMPRTVLGIKKFLEGFVHGVGRKTIDKIVDFYQEESLEKIEKDWKNLLAVDGIGELTAKKIHQAVNENKYIEKIAEFLMENNISGTEAVSVYEKFGKESIERIEKNPYLLNIIEEIEFKRIDDFGKKMGYEYDSIERVSSGILELITEEVENRGHLFLYKEDLAKRIDLFLEYRGAFSGIRHNISKEILEKSLDKLVKKARLQRAKDSRGRICLYLIDYYYIEKSIINFLKERINYNKIGIEFKKEKIEEFFEAYEGKRQLKLEEKQKEAVKMALLHRFSILTGKPGTGKTQIICALIDCLEYFYPKALIELAAPTGKASKRMAELTGKEAKTIHRLLKLSPRETMVEELEADFLIIDESSMIDAKIFQKILLASKEGVPILLVGDFEQLPSVGAGLILRDLIEADVFPITSLEKIFRQLENSQIIVNSHKLIEGKKVGEKEGLFFDNSREDFYFLPISNIKRNLELILLSIRNMIKNQGYNMGQIQVLSVMNKGYLGTNHINQVIQEKYNPPNDDKEEIKIYQKILREEDKVIQTENNYDLEIFNGEVGKIISIFKKNNSEKFIKVDFGDKLIDYSEEQAKDLELAYAITVHKAQGSEFPVVIFPIDRSLKVLMNRNIIYTAWTRAKERLVCIGEIEELNRAIDRKDNTIRNSRIKEKLREYKKEKLL